MASMKGEMTVSSRCGRVGALALFATFALLGAESSRAAGTTFPLTFTGAEETPGPGDSNGTGEGTITFDRAAGMVSWDIAHANIDAPTMMHIHTGEAGAGGGVHIGLGVATTGGAGTLVSQIAASAEVIDAILADPSAFYVNIHNGTFGNGAIRAQIPAVFNFCMCGENVVGDPGDPDGSGLGVMTFDTGSGEVTWSIEYFDTQAPTLWVIHQAPAGQGGPSVLSLGTDTSGGPGTLIDETTGDVNLVRSIVDDPEGFYLDLHNDDHPNGALRGQVWTPRRAWDLNCDCNVNSSDLAGVLGSWGNPFGASELAAVLGAWGGCP